MATNLNTLVSPGFSTLSGSSGAIMSSPGERNRYLLYPQTLVRGGSVGSVQYGSTSSSASAATLTQEIRVGEDYQAQIPELGSDSTYSVTRAEDVLWKAAPDVEARANDFVRGVHMCQMQSLKPGDLVLVRAGATDTSRYRCVVNFSQIPPTEMKEIIFYPLVVTDGKQVSSCSFSQSLSRGKNLYLDLELLNLLFVTDISGLGCVYSNYCSILCVSLTHVDLFCRRRLFLCGSVVPVCSAHSSLPKRRH
jgi:hypothetical protein